KRGRLFVCGQPSCLARPLGSRGWGWGELGSVRLDARELHCLVLTSEETDRGTEMNKIVSVIAACVVMAMALSGHAQAPYPSKPVRLLIPFPPGGPTDSAVRVFLPALSQTLGQEFSVVNMAGSHGALAPTALLSAPPDGHTLLVGNSSPLVAVPILRKD